MKFEDFKKKLFGPLRIFSLPVTICCKKYGNKYINDVEYITSFITKISKELGDNFDDILFEYRDYVEKQIVSQKIFTCERGYSHSTFEEIKEIVESRSFQRKNLYTLSLSYILSPYRYQLYRYIRQSVTKYTKPGQKCLEIGTGTGLDAVFVSSQGSEIYSYDINVFSRLCLDILDPQGLVNFQPKFYNFDEKEYYDHCLIIELLEHLENPKDYLIKANNILKNEGTATFTFALRMPQVDHLYLFKSFEDAKAMVKDVGFEILDQNLFLSSFVNDKLDELDLEEKDDFDHAAVYVCNVIKIAK